MNKKFIVLILDGFGVGYMEDCKEVRPNDVGSNTFLHILENKRELKLQNLEKLGLMNIINKDSLKMKRNSEANYGTSNLTHFGADTFWGHQEIMGSKPVKPKMEPICEKIDEIKRTLLENMYKVEDIVIEGRKLLLVNGAVTIADNIETDLGQAYNVTSALDLITFEEVVEIGKIVRSLVDVSRVIVFGGHNVSRQDLIDAIEIKGDKYIGVNAPKSGVYKKEYSCVHLGYKVNYEEQIPYILGKNNIEVCLIGKVADIVMNPLGKSIPIVDTKEAMEITLNRVKQQSGGFICTNIQETDLSGHEENVEKYASKLEIVDSYLEKIIEELKEEEILLVMADHGNDPTIGHSKHTRERVPLLIYSKGVEGCNVGTRETLSDVSQTIAEYFNVDRPQNGTSFLGELKRVGLNN